MICLGSDEDDDEDGSSKEKSTNESESDLESPSEEDGMGTEGKMEVERMSAGEMTEQTQLSVSKVSHIIFC